MHVQPGIAASKKQWSINPKFYKTMRFALDFSLRTHLDITHFLKMQWLPVDVGVEIKSQHHAQDCSWRSSMSSY